MAYNAKCKHSNFNDLKNKIMDEKEIEEYTDEMRNSGIDTGRYSWSELVLIATAMKNYHRAKLKLLGLHNVSKTK